MNILHEEKIGGQLVTIVSVNPNTEISTSTNILDGSVTLRFVEPLGVLEGEVVEDPSPGHRD